MSRDYWFDYAGGRYSAEHFGHDFLPDLRRLAEGQLTQPGQNMLEWGAGLSTLLLSDIAADRAATLVSIDHHAEYQDAVFRRVAHPSSVMRFVVDEVGPTRGHGDPELNYSTFPLSLGIDFTLILIDGRRRMECALAAPLLCGPGSIVVLHDYRRRRYQVVRALYDIIEDTRQFRIMRPRPELLARRLELLAHYRP